MRQRVGPADVLPWEDSVPHINLRALETIVKEPWSRWGPVFPRPFVPIAFVVPHIARLVRNVSFIANDVVIWGWWRLVNKTVTRVDARAGLGWLAVKVCRDIVSRRIIEVRIRGARAHGVGPAGAQQADHRYAYLNDSVCDLMTGDLRTYGYIYMYLCICSIHTPTLLSVKRPQWPKTFFPALQQATLPLCTKAPSICETLRAKDIPKKKSMNIITRIRRN